MKPNWFLFLQICNSSDCYPRRENTVLPANLCKTNKLRSFAASLWKRAFNCDGCSDEWAGEVTDRQNNSRSIKMKPNSRLGILASWQHLLSVMMQFLSCRFSFYWRYFRHQTSKDIRATLKTNRLRSKFCQIWSKSDVTFISNTKKWKGEKIVSVPIEQNVKERLRR